MNLLRLTGAAVMNLPKSCAFITAGSFFAAMLVFAQLPRADNSNLLSSRILVASEGNDRGIEISENDPVLVGAKFRLEIVASKNVTIEISLGDGYRTSTQLLQNHRIRGGTTEVLPRGNGWFSFPMVEGRQSVVLGAKGEDGKETQISRSFFVGALEKENSAGITELFSGGTLDIKNPVATGGLSDLSSTTKSSLTSNERQIAAISNLNFLPNSLSKALSFTKDLKKVFEIDLPLKFRGGGVEVYSSVASSVVKVLVNEKAGTGSIIESKGKILTNWHVVSGYRTVGIRFKPKNKMGISDQHVFMAKVIRVDEVADLALLQLPETLTDLPVISFSKIVTPEIGSNVHAIGHPSGQNWTYTRGYISQIREDFEWPASDAGMHKATVIQTQTPLNPGNSGGPLLSDRGELLGVNSFVRAKTEGINYAVSLRNIKKLLGATADLWIERPKVPVNYSLKEKLIVRKYDKDKNGIIDTTSLDLNGNGIADVIAFDKNEDGVIDYFITDANENGKQDAVVKLITAKGRTVYLWAVDSDEDGQIDAMCVDLDLDWEVDKCRKS